MSVLFCAGNIVLFTYLKAKNQEPSGNIGDPWKLFVVVDNFALVSTLPAAHTPHKPHLFTTTAGCVLCCYRWMG
jgi:hypothetical protein